MVKTSPLNARGVGSIPGQGNGINLTCLTAKMLKYKTEGILQQILLRLENWSKLLRAISP